MYLLVYLERQGTTKFVDCLVPKNANNNMLTHISSLLLYYIHKGKN